MGSLITKVNKSSSRATGKVRATSAGKKTAPKKPQRPGKITAAPKSKASKAKKSASVKAKKPVAAVKKPAAKATKKALPKKSAKPPISTAKKKPSATASKQSAAKARSVRPTARPAAPPQPKKAPAPSTLAAVRAFEQALKSFNRHDFSTAKSAFVDILDKFGDQAEIAARTRTYLTISEQRLARAPSAPRGPDALYDQGVFELNKGNTREAIELFDKALKAEPRADHILYSLAAAYARLNDTSRAIDALRRAINIRSVHRPHARRDLDFASLRSNEDFQQLTGYGYDFMDD